MKPNAMCIGAAKSGTTTLYDILKNHSDVFPSSFKEPHFFDIPDVYSKGLEWYLKTYFNKYNKQSCIIDFTPTYLFEKQAAKRIYNDLGNSIKFIIILRHPVDRAYSHFMHSYRDSHEIYDFKTALNLEKKRINDKDYLSKLRFSYIHQGLYYESINNYFQLFPRENFMIINFEKEFLDDRKKTINKIQNFLGLKNELLNTNLYSNKSSVPRSMWLKELFQKKGVWRDIGKKIIPSLKYRQFIKNKLQTLNLKQVQNIPLSAIDKKHIFETYFKEDVKLLEKLINKEMNWE
ncbi:MAG: hypothetical protein CMD06_07160 [Flavobacteriales bacterium]|nr:hypothetical protein [Flavobacteriales bacterium]|tara:strand:- start:5485 stop:6357 length:873 start_codon:yes stop_codon:yes gene_type:complete